MARGNGRHPPKSYKKDQKNVSVYLGKSSGWEAQVLEAVCAVQGWKESQLFRKLFFERLAKWGLYDPDTGEPNMEKVTKLKAEAARKILPDVLDFDQDDA